MEKKEPNITPGFKKGDAFVQMEPHPLVFMEVNEVDEALGNKDICIVTWYSLEENSLNVQRRFPMVAVDGEFCNFEPISRKLLKDAKSLMRQYDADVKLLTVKAEAKSLYNNYTRKLIELLPDAENRLAIALQIEKKIITNEWLDCTEDNYWVEEEPEQKDKYFTLVCMTIESYDDKNDQTIAEQYIYLHDNCPYSWNILANSDAKYMVVEKPKIHKNNS
ncbi:MAG: hypothetical protein IKK81_05110 [Prevotella sp.]|nr:hypothetical protein [Prevotella sp.]